MLFPFKKPRRDLLKNIVYGVVGLTISPFIHQSNAKSVTTNQELDDCLTKAISEFKVRDMLTKFGIPEDAEVTLEMQLDENSKPIASCSVPTVINKDAIPSGSMSLRDLQNSLIDDFINPAIKTFDLSKRIADVEGIADVEESTEDDENKLIISLKSQTPNYKFSYVSAACCCLVGCGKCCGYCPCDQGRANAHISLR